MLLLLIQICMFQHIFTFAETWFLFFFFLSKYITKRQVPILKHIFYYFIGTFRL